MLSLYPLLTMVTKIISILLMLSSIQDLRVASYSLKVSSDYVRLSPEASNVTLACSTGGVAIKRCQFRWWDNHGSAGPLLELSEGVKADAHSTHLSEAMSDYGYSGRGLAEGECGLTMEVKGEKRWIVSCRVEAESGGWKYAWSELHARNKSFLSVLVPPKEMIVLPRNVVKIQIRSRVEPLSRCNFLLPGFPRKVAFKDGDKFSNTTDNQQASYSGAGLKKGDCSLTLTNVQEENNGPALVWISNPESTSEYSRFVALIVARPPSPPVMHSVKNGDDVTATCVVQGSRPLAKITWFLGDDIIRQDSDDDDSPSDPQDGWRWPWMHGSISQKVTVTLKPEHNGKMLKCQTSHVALEEPLEASERIVSIVPTTTEAPVPPTTTAESIVEPVPCKECPEKCPKNNEVQEQLLREAKAMTAIRELAEEAARMSLEAAKEKAKADEARARDAEAGLVIATLELEQAKFNARVEEARAKNAEEELEFQRERRKLGHRLPEGHRKGYRNNRM